MRRWVALRAASPAVLADHGGALPARLPRSAWALGICAFFAAYLFVFMYVHVVADTRACGMRLDDPLYALIPYDPRWQLITFQTYIVLTLACVASMFLQAALGDHRPIVRFGLGIAIMGTLRSLCILLVPLCRVTAAPGSVRLSEIPTLDLGVVTIPWRMFASNDLLFSGHVGEFFLLLRLTRSWPRWARAVLWVFSALQIYGLLANRGHYTVDILLAFPCAYFADRMAVNALARLATGGARAAQKA